MATASEIKVIEAYIGLLGRAPDPAGLAYWAGELDAAGGTTDAMKKLTNDITLNDEWTSGTQGSLLAADGSITLANAKTLVVDIYQNLFERAVVTDTDQTYWAEQLVDGTVTASEMTVLLIAAAQEKGNADSQTLALKEEAAQYYVENVTQEQFNRDSAGDSVSAVDSPNSLAASKAATDLIASDTGNDYVLSSTVTEATVVFTGATDTVTGVFGAGATYSAGALEDISASDNDSLTLTGDRDLTFGTVKDVENINVSIAKSKVAGSTIDMTAVTGADATSVTMAATVDIVGVEVTGETVLTIDDPRGDLTTTGVTDLTITNASALAQTYSFDSALTSFTQNATDAVNANDTNLVFANDSVAIDLQGTAATNDSVSITVGNEASLTLTTANVEDVTITSNNDVATVTVDVVHASSDDITYTLAGSNDVTLKAADGQELSDSKFTNAGTGDLGIILTGGTASNLDSFGVLGNGLTLAADSAFDLHLASGNTVTNTVTNTNATKIDANDAVTDTSSITLVLTNDTTGGLNLDNYETVVIDTDDSRLTGTGNIDLNGADATIGGSNDVTIGSLATGGSVSAVADDLVVGAISAMNDVTLVGQNDVTITSVATTQNDVDVDAGGDISTGALAANATTGTIDLKGAGVAATGKVDSVKGSVVLEATANDVVIVDIEAQNDITLKAVDDITATSLIDSEKGSISIETTGGVAGNDVTVVTVTAQNDITLKGDDVTASNAITVDTANGGSVTITATNDINLSTDNSDVTSTDDITLTAGKDVKTVADDPDLIAANDIVITAGNDINMDSTTATNMTATAGDITLTGDQILIEGEVKATAGTVTVTGNDSDQSDIKTVTALNLTVNDGNLLVDTATLTGNLSVSGDADFQSGAASAAVVALNTTNDVTLTTLSAELIVGGGTGDYDLGTVSNGDADDTDGVSITLGAGNDTMILNDEDNSAADSVYTVNSGAGKDTITITDVKAGSVINSSTGDDTLSIGQTASVTVVTGDGNDTLTISAASTGSIAMGNDTDTLDITGAVSLVGTTVTDFEKLVLDAGDLTVDQAFLDNDSSFIVSGGGGNIVATNITSADMSGVTFDGTATGVQFTAAAAGSTMTGTGNVDTLTGGAGNDVLTGGSGADLISGKGGINTITLTEGSAAKDVVTFGSGADSITGFETGNGAAKDDLGADLTDIEGNITGTDVVNTQGLSIGAEAMTLLTITGATDLNATDANAIIVDGNIADAAALEVALQTGGGFELTAGTGGFTANEAFLVVFDNGVNSYVAAVTTSAAVTNGNTFGDVLTAKVLVTLTGIADATDVVVENFADIVV